MKRKKLNLYEAVYYDGWGMYPAYYLLGQLAEGMTPEDALRQSLPRLIAEVRRMFQLDGEISDEKIQETLYVIRPDGLVSVRCIES